jgi:hypothetical protein
MRARLTPLALIAAALTGLSLETAGCNLVLGIKDLSGSGLDGGGGQGGSPSASSGSASSSGNTASSGGASSSNSSSSSSGPSSSSSSSSGPSSSSSSSGGCGDTTSSAANCGACGHSCDGGQCLSSQCLQVDLTTGVPGAIAVDATSVYWTHQPLPSNASIMVSPKTGGSGNSLADAIAPTAIALDANNVYWTDYDGTTGSVGATPKKAAAQVQIATAPGQPMGLAVSATDVYWTVQGVGLVLSAPTSAMKATGTKFASGFLPTGIAVDASSVYWSDWGSASGSIEDQSFGGTLGPELAMGQGKVQSVAVSGGVVYWVAMNTGDLSSAAAGSTSKMATILATGQPQTHPQYIAVSGADIYWTVDGGIMRFSVGVSPTPTQIINGQATINGLAADETGAFWTTSDGFVRYVAR